MYFFGGGQDKDQLEIYPDLINTKKQQLKQNLIDHRKPILAICGGYQLLGTQFLASNGDKIEGLGILDLETVAPSSEMESRAVGNLVTEIESENLKENSQKLNYIVGFENHSGRTKFNHTDLKPLGEVISGIGDNFDRENEGVFTGNIVGSYCHGPILPKNPHLADYLIAQALSVKTGEEVKLSPLEDSEEIAAHEYILEKFGNIN